MICNNPKKYEGCILHPPSTYHSDYCGLLRIIEDYSRELLLLQTRKLAGNDILQLKKPNNPQ